MEKLEKYEHFLLFSKESFLSGAMQPNKINLRQ